MPGERANAFLLTQCGTATDLLRVAVSLFEGDASLAAPTRFGRMGRAWRKLILQALEETRWNRTAAAQRLGLTFLSMRYRLKKLGLD